jgi:hypothetical protein
MIDSRSPFVGRVKFLQADGGSPPIVEQVVPVLIGSNFYFNSEFSTSIEIPLSINNEVVTGTQNKSFIVQDTIAGFKFWFVSANLQFNDEVLAENVDIVVQLYIDGISVDTQTLTLDNPYSGEINFDLSANPSLITSDIYYRVDIYDAGTLNYNNTARIKIPSTTTCLYSSVYGCGLRYNGFLTNYYEVGACYIDDTQQSILGNFGGSAYLNSQAFNPISMPSPIDMVVVGCYIVVSGFNSGFLPSNSISGTLVVNGVSNDATTIVSIVDILLNTEIYASFTSGSVSISQGDSFYFLLEEAYTDGSVVNFQEIGLIYRVDI